MWDAKLFATHNFQIYQSVKIEKGRTLAVLRPSFKARWNLLLKEIKGVYYYYFISINPR